jgi:hypothetical protein
MQSTKFFVAAVAALLLVGLSACSAADSSNESPTGGANHSAGAESGTLAPTTFTVGELPGTEVTLKVGQVLNITTGDLSADSYTGEVKDAGIAEFIAGKVDKSAVYNPGVKGLAAGATEVTLTNSDSAIEPIVFKVTVIK